MWLWLLLTSACNICQRHWKQAVFAHSSGVILAYRDAKRSLWQIRALITSVLVTGPLWVEKILEALTLGDPFKTH